jgi:ABC-type Mn2+/Zn2+ transport system ATPase subunit
VAVVCSLWHPLCSAGSKLAIVGPNGAGKSTLLKILGKRAQHDAGTVSRKEVGRDSTGAEWGWVGSEWQQQPSYVPFAF